MSGKDAPVRGGRSPGSPRRKALVRVLLVTLALIAALLVWRLLLAKRQISPNVVQLSGRIEGDDSAVAPKTAGRIVAITVREGDLVKAGQTIATLDDEQVHAREQQAHAALLGAQAKAEAARAQIAILEEQLKQYQLQSEQAQSDADGRVRQAEADLAAAEANLQQQEASYDLAAFDRDAYTRLAKTGAVSERQGKLSVSTAEQQGAALAATRRKAEAAKGALQVAKANLSTPSIRNLQVAATRRQIVQQGAEVSSAAAEAQQARFQLDEAKANRSDLVVKAPFDGTVITRSAEPGEVVTAGTTIVTLLDMSKIYLRGYVPEGRIGQVKLGQRARMYLDSQPDHPVDAYVSRVDPQATFTPENTYFRDDRVKQVVGVKLQLRESLGFAKPGMPADGEILVRGHEWPAEKGHK
ncbi:MAG: HlyD family secretion protein [Bryobacteraceae bacterium]